MSYGELDELEVDAIDHGDAPVSPGLAAALPLPPRPARSMPGGTGAPASPILVAAACTACPPEASQPDAPTAGAIPRGGDTEWMQAEALRKTGEYPRAGRMFHEMWSAHGWASAGWRYVFCLRKAGYPEAGLRVIQRVRQQWPEDGPARTEHLWCLYAARLQPAMKQEGAEQAVLEAAREMVDAGAEGLPLQLAVFAAVGAAKRKGHWGEVSRWCDRLDPSNLGRVPQDFGGRRVMSERERWFFAKVKSLVELSEWENALQVSELAIADFPSKQDFRRWHAAALAGLERLDEALQELDTLRRRGCRAWYIIADLGTLLFRAGRIDEAWEVCCQALHLPGEDQARVGLLATMAEIALARSDPATAADHLGWCVSLRHAQGWPVGGSLQIIMGKIERELGSARPDWSQKPAEWKRRCYGSPPARPQLVEPSRPVATPVAESPQPPVDETRYWGKVARYEAGKTFAFIAPARGEAVFVKASDLPPACRENGRRVEYSLVPNFDSKKGRESVRAVKVTPA